MHLAARITAIASGLALLGSITAQNLSTLIITSIMIPLGMGFTVASVNTIVSLRSSAGQQDTVLGPTYSVSGIAQILGPASGASIFDYGISVGVDGLQFIISVAATIPAVILALNLKGGFARWLSCRLIRKALLLNHGSYEHFHAYRLCI